MTTTMRAVVLDEPGPATNLHLRHVPIPEPRAGWVRIQVKAFGLNRSELPRPKSNPGGSYCAP